MYGHNRVPRHGAVLLVCNHQSNLDPMLIGVRLDRRLSYMAKSELFQNRFLSSLFRWLGGFPVRQGAVDVQALKEAIARLRQGEALTIFPEGSRSPNGNLLPIQRGVGLVVHRTKALVLPVVVDGSFQAWPMQKRIFRPAKIRLLYGAPVDLSDLEGDQIVQWIERTICEMFGKLRELEAADGH